MIKLEVALQKALHYLRSQQQADGSFASFSSSQAKPFHAAYTYRTTFAPAIILGALSGLDHPRALDIRAKLADFLTKQKSDRWSFNYWARDVPEAKTFPYPDDLDDTFCTLSALWLHDTSLLDEAVLAQAVKLLLATESQLGGPYRTWLVPADDGGEWQDIDLAVNANIAYFLTLVSNPLPHLTAFLERAIRERDLRSRYYTAMYPVAYYVARAYRGPHQSQLAHLLLDNRRDGGWGTPLSTALALTSLLRLGVRRDVEDAVAYLLETQAADGSWGAEAFSLDPTRNGRTCYSGSPALTTAFVIESLHTYQQQLPTKTQPQPASVHSLQKQVAAQAAKELKTLDRDLHRDAKAVLDQTMQGKNAQEITMLPYLFYQSLKNRPVLPDEFLVDLGLANLYGWMAYTIYDDLLDNEGETGLLSVANVSLRRSISAFWRALPRDAIFQRLVHVTLDAIDAANTWEIARCRFAVDQETIMIGRLPVYGRLERLAERSLGHTLTPLGVLAASGTSLHAPAAQAIQASLHHYLIARQLNDDIHDWQADLKAGRITYVVAQMLKSQPGLLGTQHFTELLPQLERQFWHHTITQVCRRMTQHVTYGRQALQQTDLLIPDNIIAKLLDDIDESIKETHCSVAGAKKFLKAYQNND